MWKSWRLAAMSALVVVVVLAGCGGKDAPKTPAVDAQAEIAADTAAVVQDSAVTDTAVSVITDTAATFTDPRDGKTYKKVTIGKQVWMAENLNYDVPNVTTDVCYDNKAENCVKHGRLYNWETALKACPAGWHLPSDAEWGVLMVAVGGVKDDDDFWQGAGKRLKSASGWYNDGNGTDAHGFSALPGGYGSSDGYFDNAGYFGYWWSATEYGASRAWNRRMSYYLEYVYRDYYIKSSLFAVRCVQDTGGQK